MTSLLVGATQWNRLHPLTIVKEIGSMAWAIVAAIVFDFDSIPPIPGVPDAIDPDTLIAVGVFVWAVVRYLFTSYRITEQTVDFRSGVLVKTSQSTPRSRIQTVAIATPLIGRLVGVTTVEISAADGEDIRLSYVSAPHAENLRMALESERGRPTDEDEPDRQLLADLDPRRHGVFALTEGMLVIALVVMLAGVALFVFDLRLVPMMLVIGATLAGWPVTKTLALISFRSWIDGDRLKTESGLLSRKEAESLLVRIQSVGVLRPALRRWLGYESVIVVTGDPTVSKDGAPTSGMTAPLVPIGQWRSLAEVLIGYVPLGETDLRPSSRFTIRRTIVRGSVLVAVIVAAGLAVSVWLPLPRWPLAAVAVMGVGVAWAYARARYRVLGYVADDDYLLVRHGVLVQRLNVVPIHKVQDAVIVETLFQRRLGLATVAIDTAGVAFSAIRAIDLPRGEARALADHLMGIAARTALPDGV